MIMLLYDRIIYNANDTQGAIVEFLSGLSDTLYLDEELEFKIKIIVGELVNNYFEHEEECSHVRILAKPRGSCISIALLEDSHGFDVSAAISAGNISEEKTLMNESGRGLHIVSMLSDALRYNRKGNIIAIHVNLV
jgi:Anti-sigma regulatory factor (Ser/Thr protein kinase)